MIPPDRIKNSSGTLDVSPWRAGGVWLVIEDSTGICSIGLSAEETRRLRKMLGRMEA